MFAPIKSPVIFNLPGMHAQRQSVSTLTQGNCLLIQLLGDKFVLYECALNSLRP